MLHSKYPDLTAALLDGGSTETLTQNASTIVNDSFEAGDGASAASGAQQGSAQGAQAHVVGDNAAARGAAGNDAAGNDAAGETAARDNAAASDAAAAHAEGSGEGAADAKYAGQREVTGTGARADLGADGCASEPHTRSDSERGPDRNETGMSRQSSSEESSSVQAGQSEEASPAAVSTPKEAQVSDEGTIGGQEGKGEGKEGQDGEPREDARKQADQKREKLDRQGEVVLEASKADVGERMDEALEPGNLEGVDTEAVGGQGGNRSVTPSSVTTVSGGAASAIDSEEGKGDESQGGEVKDLPDTGDGLVKRRADEQDSSSSSISVPTGGADREGGGGEEQVEGKRGGDGDGDEGRAENDKVESGKPDERGTAFDEDKGKATVEDEDAAAEEVREGGWTAARISSLETWFNYGV